EIELVRLLEAPEQTRFFLEDMERHLRVDADRDAALAAFHGDAADGALDAPDHRVGSEDAAGAAAMHARLGERLEEGRPDALPRHFDEPELRDLERAGAGAVPVQVGAELLEHAVLVGAGLHVNEVTDDDAA